MYDVIVIGAGPAGSSLGYFLAKEGTCVLVLEKERLPRKKSCAGGIPPTLEQLLGFGLDKVVEQRIREIDFTYRLKGKIVLKGNKSLLYTVMRHKFDHFLAEKAQATGAEILDREKAIDIEVDDDGVAVITDKHRFNGKIVVGADGATSLVTRKSRLVKKRRIITAVQGEVWVDDRTLGDFQNRVVADFGYVPFGYGWVFPKRDHLSIGIGGLALLNNNLTGLGLKKPRPYFDNLLKKAVPSYQKIEIESYAFPVWGGDTRLTTRRIILIGDAASLGNPLTGAGIYSAIWSSKLATKTIIDCLRNGRYDLSEYERLIEQEMAPELNAARTLSKIFYPIPWLSFNLGLRRKSVTRLWMEAEAPYCQLLRHVWHKLLF